MTHKHHYSMKNFIHDVGHVTKPLHKDVFRLVNGVGKTFNHVVDVQGNVANNLIKTSGSTLSSLSLPLLVIGGGVLIYMVTKK